MLITVRKLFGPLLATCVLVGCGKDVQQSVSHITFTCIELTKEQKRQLNEDDAIPRGSLVNTKSEADCLKSGGYPISKLHNLPRK